MFSLENLLDERPLCARCGKPIGFGQPRWSGATPTDQWHRACFEFGPAREGTLTSNDPHKNSGAWGRCRAQTRLRPSRCCALTIAVLTPCWVHCPPRFWLWAT